MSRRFGADGSIGLAATVRGRRACCGLGLRTRRRRPGQVSRRHRRSSSLDHADAFKNPTRSPVHAGRSNRRAGVCDSPPCANGRFFTDAAARKGHNSVDSLDGRLTYGIDSWAAIRSPGSEKKGRVRRRRNLQDRWTVVTQTEHTNAAALHRLINSGRRSARGYGDAAHEHDPSLPSPKHLTAFASRAPGGGAYCPNPNALDDSPTGAFATHARGLGRSRTWDRDRHAQSRKPLLHAYDLVTAA